MDAKTLSTIARHLIWSNNYLSYPDFKFRVGSKKVIKVGPIKGAQSTTIFPCRNQKKSSREENILDKVPSSHFIRP